MLADRISKITSSKTSEARNEAARLKDQGMSIINLTAGELAADVPPEIQEAAIASIHQNKNRYTEAIGINELRELVALQASKRIGTSYSKKQVAITNGAKHGLFNTIFALFNPGDKVVVLTPCWGTFVAQLKMLAIEPVFVDTTPHHFQIDPKALEAAIDHRTKGIILNTPNNPTGAIYSAKVLKEIAKIAKSHNLWVIFDECYRELAFPNQEHHNIVTLDPEMKDRVIIIDSFSKSHALTGWRIGYVIGKEEVIEGIKAIQSHSTSNPNVIAQYGVLPILQKPSLQFITNVRFQIHHTYSQAKSILNSIPHLSFIEPQGAFYIFVNFQWYLENNPLSINSIDQLCQFLLVNAHVAVVSGSAFYSPYYARISISGAEKEVLEGIQKIKEGLLQLTQKPDLLHI